MATGSGTCNEAAPPSSADKGSTAPSRNILRNAGAEARQPDHFARLSSFHGEAVDWLLRAGSISRCALGWKQRVVAFTSCAGETLEASDTGLDAGPGMEQVNAVADGVGDHRGATALASEERKQEIDGSEQVAHGCHLAMTRRSRDGGMNQSTYARSPDVTCAGTGA
jgi:hypothetical protein